MCSDHKVNPTSSSDWLIALPLSVYLKEKRMHQQFGKSLPYSLYLKSTGPSKNDIHSIINVFTYMISANVFSSSLLKYYPVVNVQNREKNSTLIFVTLRLPYMLITWEL